MSKKIISFSLYGDLEKYNIGAINNVKLALKFYKDWECWFYIDNKTVPVNIINTLSKFPNVKIIYKDTNNINNPMYWRTWRFEAIDDIDVNIMISRDTDTLIYRREVLAVEEWVKSDKQLHILKDSPCHLYNIIQCGMFGIKKGDVPIPNIKSLAYNYFISNTNSLITDSSFLEDYIYSIFKYNSLIHDEFTNILKFNNPDNLKFNNYPIRYNPEYDFIGEYRYPDGSRDEMTSNILKNILSHYPYMIQKYKPIKYSIIFCKNIYSIQLYNKYIEYYNKYNIKTILVLIHDTNDNIISQDENIIIIKNSINKDFYEFCKYIIPLLYTNEEVGIISHDLDLNLREYNHDSYINFFKDNSNEEMIIYDYTFDIDSKIIYYGDIKYICNKINQGNIFTDLNKIYYLYDIFKNKNNLLNIFNNTIYPLVTKYNEEYCGIIDMYIIHYTKLIDRKKFMLKQIHELGLDKIFNIIWVENYDRENITNDIKDKYYKYDPIIYHRYLTSGEIANGIAHLNVIQSICYTNNTSLIIEDDIVFTNYFIKSLKYLSYLQSDWNILNIGGCYYNNNTNNELIHNNDIHEIYIPHINSTTVSCYIIKPEMAKEIMNLKSCKPFNLPIDEHLYRILLNNNKLRVYWVKPWLAVEGSKLDNFFNTSFTDRGF
jgi:GR25 family glycosyltransferase involved in LPS biosynthesis